MENNLFVATMLGCGTFDLDIFFEKLDRYEDTVFVNDELFSYQALIEQAKFETGNNYDIKDLMRVLDNMAIDSALAQIKQSEKFDEFDELVHDSVRYWDNYNYSGTKIFFDNKEELKKFDEWKEFSELLLL